jgi:hypothetical protein
MHIVQSQQRKMQSDCGMCRKKVVNDRGLGEEAPLLPELSRQETQKQYGGQSEAAPMAAMGIKLVATVALMFIPVVGWAAALLINVPVVGDAILSPIMGPIMKMMKKATHMESCMNWWTDSNIKSMIAGMAPYPIGVEVRREYKLQRGQDMSVIEGARWENMASKYVRLVRANPSLMEAQCASMPQGRGETGMTEADAITVGKYFTQLKLQAQYEEYMEIAGSYAKTAGQKIGVTQELRKAATMFQLPTGVMSIDKGALVLMPGVSSNKVIEMFAGKVPVKVAVVQKSSSGVVGGKFVEAIMRKT